ncbi:MAG: hypothetical protein NTV54_07840 [Ignavibacteriales bacterium]|nr:hypothetical protein [Ignavibacteriales bacterium]
MKPTLSQEVGLWKSGFPLVQGLEQMQNEMKRAFGEFFRDDAGSGSMFIRR